MYFSSFGSLYFTDVMNIIKKSSNLLLENYFIANFHFVVSLFVSADLSFWITTHFWALLAEEQRRLCVLILINPLGGKYKTMA